MAEAVEKAYLAIRGGITDGSLPSGVHLRAGELAEGLGVSRTPVREALRRLHAEGLVNFVANHGAYVASWTRADVDEVFGLRAKLESYAAELATAALTAQQLEELSELAEEMTRLIRARPEAFLAAVQQANGRFHRIIVDAAAGRRLAAMIATVIESQIVLQTFRHYTAEELERSMAHHRELVSAFRARDARWAASVMHSHVLAAHHAFIASDVRLEAAKAGEIARRRG